MATTSKKLALAALTGLLGTSILAAGVAHATDGEKMEKAAAASVKEKHACKGLNSCKGKGADGKNECKGKGSCRTDGKTEEEAK